MPPTARTASAIKAQAMVIRRRRIGRFRLYGMTERPRDLHVPRHVQAERLLTEAVADDVVPVGPFRYLEGLASVKVTRGLAHDLFGDRRTVATKDPQCPRLSQVGAQPPEHPQPVARGAKTLNGKTLNGTGPII